MRKTLVVFVASVLWLGVAAPQIANAQDPSLNYSWGDLATADLVYSDVTGLIYASVPAGSGPSSDSLVTIDPATGTIGSPTPIGADPGELAISDDGSTIYVALNGSKTVRRFDVATHTPGIEFSVGEQPASNDPPEPAIPYHATELEVLPGQPDSVAIVSSDPDGNDMELYVYTNGVRRTNGIFLPFVDKLEFAGSAADLRGFDDNSSSRRLYRHTVDNDGIYPNGYGDDLVQAGRSPNDIEYANGMFYTRLGRVIDPVLETVVGSYLSLNPSLFRGTVDVEPDLANKQVYFVTDPENASFAVSLTTYDINTFDLLNTTSIPEATGIADSLIKAGPSHLAFRTEGDQVFLVEIGVFAKSVSGRITDHVDDPVPLGRVEVYTAEGDFVLSMYADMSGEYRTPVLPEGSFYILLYNGDEETFYDWFPEWYSDAPLLRIDRATLLTPGSSSLTEIDARLSLMYVDMWDSTFLNDIIWMQNTGITKGCGEGLYCVDDLVTRGQMAAFLGRALGLTDDGGGDLFIDDDNSIFENDIDRLATAGITKGCNPPVNDRYCPNDPVTRGQMAAFLHRALGGVLYPASTSGSPTAATGEFALSEIPRP